MRCAILRLGGEFEADKLDALSRALMTAAEAGRTTIVVDLRRLTLWRSDALRAFVEIVSGGQRNGWRFLIVRPRDKEVSQRLASAVPPDVGVLAFGTLPRALLSAAFAARVAMPSSRLP
jgi:anti-anti-sigma factor